MPARHERKKTLFLKKGKRIAAGLKPLAMTGRRIATHLTAVSPAGSVGASAPQRCPPDTRTFAMTKRPVILSDVTRNDSGVYSIRKGFNSSVNKNGRVKAFIFYFRKAVSRFTVFNTSSLSAFCAMRHSQLPEGTPGVFSLSHESSCK